jgi:hypothetical protein
MSGVPPLPTFDQLWFEYLNFESLEDPLKSSFSFELHRNFHESKQFCNFFHKLIKIIDSFTPFHQNWVGRKPFEDKGSQKPYPRTDKPVERRDLTELMEKVSF